MPLVPDHTASMRQRPTPDPEEESGDVSLHVRDADNDDSGGDRPILDGDGNTIRIQHGDGSVTVSIDGKPLEQAEKNKKKIGWFSNLIDEIDQEEINRITDDLFRGVADDMETRKDYIEDRAIGIKLLALKIEIPSTQSASDSAPVEGMSKVRHPLLLEACLRFQANASAEMLPADGPAKIRDDDINSNAEEDQLANAYERDLNHYLTTTATEYFPDTDRMLLMLGFGGSAFKKVYFCPLRNRPVCESVDATDIIVNTNATDLSNARRVTHRSTVKPSTIRRLQILEVYKDVVLPDPMPVTLDSAQLEKKNQEGMSADVTRAEDRDREIYEILCELDVKGFEHKHNGKTSGLEIPYRVTLDASSKQMLAIVRNYNEDDQKLPTARKMFVQYMFVPGFGFYGIGLLHILGNTTNAVTATWRELLDAGMFSNFPGFLIADSGARQNTNIFRIPPGGAAVVKTGGLKIGDAVMNLPYKEPSQALMALAKDIVETGQRIGGTSELQVGEGRADTPVGTALTQVEQAKVVLNAVHKRMHRAQAEELQLLVDCFREHPESFWQRNKKPALPWDQRRFTQALNDFDLVPRADPNTASYIQRVLKIMALKQLQQAQPALYDPIAIDKAALKALGWNNPEQFMAPPAAQAQKPPQMVQAEAEMAIHQKDADSRAKAADAKVAETQAKIQGGFFKGKDGGDDKGLGPAEMITAKARLMDAETKSKDLIVRHHERQSDDVNRDQDRKSRERLGILGLAKEVIMHGATKEHDRHKQDQEHKHDAFQQHREHQHADEQQEEDHSHERVMQKEAPKPKAGGK